MSKASQKRGKLHPASFQAFVQELYKDPKLKAQAIADLEREGLRAFVARHFDLITRQKKELDTIKDRDAEDVFTAAIVAALHRNSPLVLNHEGHNPPNMRIEIRAGGADGWGVVVHC